MMNRLGRYNTPGTRRTGGCSCLGLLVLLALVAIFGWGGCVPFAF